MQPHFFGTLLTHGLATVRYEALIRTEDGTFLDRGTARTDLLSADRPVGTADAERFGEAFITDGIPPVPFTRQDCKDQQFAALVDVLGGEKECKNFVKDKNG